MSQSIPAGYIPLGISSKNLPRRSGFTFESYQGSGNSTRDGILWKMRLNLKKNSVDQIFTGENKKEQVEFFTFFEVHVFFR